MGWLIAVLPVSPICNGEGHSGIVFCWQYGTRVSPHLPAPQLALCTGIGCHSCGNMDTMRKGIKVTELPVWGQDYLSFTYQTEAEYCCIPVEKAVYPLWCLLWDGVSARVLTTVVLGKCNNHIYFLPYLFILKTPLWCCVPFRSSSHQSSDLKAHYMSRSDSVPYCLPTIWATRSWL